MQAIVRKRQYRNLVERDKSCLNFQVRNRDVEQHKIQRWMRVKSISEQELYYPSPAAGMLDIPGDLIHY